MIKFITAAIAALALAACAGLATKVDNTLANPKTQQDVQWACFGLQGAVSFASKIDTKRSDIYSKAQIVLGAPCQAARDGKLTNANELYAVVMDLAGQLAAEISKKTDY